MCSNLETLIKIRAEEGIHHLIEYTAEIMMERPFGTVF